MEVRGSDEPVVYPLKAHNHALNAFSSGDASAVNARRGRNIAESAPCFSGNGRSGASLARNETRALKFVDTRREFLLPRGAKIPTLVASGQSFQHERGMFSPRAFN
jgi:hypothetical protein